MQHFISRKSSRFELKLGELVNLTFLFRVDELGFSCLNDTCYGKKKKAFLQLPQKLIKSKILWTHFMCTFCYDEQPLKILEQSQQVVSEIKCWKKIK